MGAATHGGLEALLGLGSAATTQVVLLAQRDLHQGNAAAAREAAEIACWLSPARPDAWRVRARACRLLGHTAVADTYEQIIERLEDRHDPSTCC